MLELAALQSAMRTAQQRAAVCRRWCSVGVGIDPMGGVYEAWHNGAGGSDTDHQWIYRQTRLDMNEASLSGLFTFWLEGLHHNGEAPDLNGPLG